MNFPVPSAFSSFSFGVTTPTLIFVTSRASFRISSMSLAGNLYAPKSTRPSARLRMIGDVRLPSGGTVASKYGTVCGPGLTAFASAGLARSSGTGAISTPFVLFISELIACDFDSIAFWKTTGSCRSASDITPMARSSTPRPTAIPSPIFSPFSRRKSFPPAFAMSFLRSAPEGG